MRREVIFREIEPVHGQDAWCSTEEEIVRCRDCKEHNNKTGLCEYFSVNAGIEMYGHIYTELDGHCYMGVRHDD